jgi:2,5-diketo-D-gluconate reductase B
MQGTACQEAVESALALGYRHIDTAEMYGNEEAVGTAIAASGIARHELHVTTKVWHDHLAPDALARALDGSLQRLRLDHVDLNLVHWPARDMDLPATLAALMQSREVGRARAIGVANFTLPMLKHAIDEIGAPIACNQVEYHVFLDQTPMLNYLRSKEIPLVAYCPLAQGRAADSGDLVRIGEKYGVSASHVALAWLLGQDGVVAIPKAGRAISQRANLDALSLVLDDEDRQAIASLPKRERLVNPPFAPRWDVSITQ